MSAHQLWGGGGSKMYPFDEAIDLDEEERRLRYEEDVASTSAAFQAIYSNIEVRVRTPSGEEVVLRPVSCIWTIAGLMIGKYTVSEPGVHCITASVDGRSFGSGPMMMEFNNPEVTLKPRWSY